MQGPWPDFDVTTSDSGWPSAESRLADVPPPKCGVGRITDGGQLPDRPDLYYRNDPARSWGEAYLVDTIVAVAEELAFTVPDADPLFIGDMSRKGGGWLRGHVTHDVGLDADIGLFSIDRHQPLSGFEDVPSWKLDTEATWLLIKAFLDTGRVDFILLDQSLIRKLRTYLLENAILPEDEVDRIFPPYATAKWWDLDGIVRHASGHRNHMHVRVRCE